MISISAFIISLSGIISLLYFRLWEVKRGARLFNIQRKELDEKIISFGEYIENHVPTFDRTIIPHAYHTVVHYFALIILGILRIIERWMVSLLEHVRGKREVRRGVTQSDFLKSVKEHKQSLENPSRNSVE
jgi:hypothetical protein